MRVEAVAQSLTKHGLKVFLDRWYLTPGQPWPKMLEQVLGSCQSMAIFLGDEGLGPWQQRERDLALDRQSRENSFPVIPVLLSQSDPGLGFLKTNTWVDLTMGTDYAKAIGILVSAIRGKPPGPPNLRQIESAGATVCPYRGLKHFREEDEPYFFGRNTFSKALTHAVLTQPLIAVVGASGSGKSSVVRAGLFPRLRRGAGNRVWEIVTLVPGERPMSNLAAALMPGIEPEISEIDRLAEVHKLAEHLTTGSVTLLEVVTHLLEKQPGTDRLLLFVDQWEELYTLCTDDNTRKTFIEHLLEVSATGKVFVTLTLRGDFMGQALDNRVLADRLQDGIVTIGPMTREELAETILRPAEKVGLKFEAGLPETILDDLGDEPGGLPLLEFLLEGLWTSRQGTTLTHEAYARLGRVSGAIARRAEDVFEHDLDDAERAAARRLLMRMVRPGEGVEDTRRRTALPEGDPTAERTIYKLSQERLIVTERDAGSGAVTVAVAHEALIHRWQRFRDWIDADREFLRTRERITAAARLWKDEARSPERLLPHGRPLAEGEDLLATRRTDLEPLLIDYIRASSDAARAAEEARQVAQRRHLRKARLLAAAMTALAVIAIGGGVTAWWQRGVAERNAKAAARQARLARSAELVTRARSLFEGTPGHNTTAALLAVESLRLGGGSEAQGLINEILALTPRGIHELAYVPPDSKVIQSPDGKINLVWQYEGFLNSKPGTGIAIVLDPKTGAVRARVEHEGWTAPVLSPGGRWLTVGGWGRRFQVVDLSTGDSVIDESRPGLTVAAFSPDGSRLYVADGGGTVETRAAPDWRVVSKARFREGKWDNRRLSILPSPDDKTLLISFGGGAWLGPPSGPFRPLPDLKPFVWKAAFDSSGTRMLVIAGRSRVEIREVSSGEVLTRIQRFGIESFTFSPDDTRLAIGDEDSIIDLWDTMSGKRLLELDHDKKNVNALAYTPDGSRLVAAYASGALRVFNAGNGVLLNTWVRPSAITAATFGKDGAALYLGDKQGMIYRFDPENGSATEVFRPPGPPESGIWPLVLDPQSGLLVAGIRTSGDAYSWTDLRGIDAKTGQELWHQAHNGHFYQVTFSPDGAIFATANPRKGDDDLSIWDTVTGTRLHQQRVVVYRDGLHFTGNGNRLVVTSDETKVIDPSSDAVLFDIGEPGGVDGMAVLPDRKTIVTYGNDGIVRAWDASSGEERWRREEPDLGWRLPFSGNAARYAQGTADGRSLVVHDTRSGAEIARIPLTSRHMRAVLSPTGNRLLLASPSLDDPLTGERYLKVELWDVNKGELLHTLRGLPTFADVEFGPDGYARVFILNDRLTVLDSETGEVLWEEPFQRDWIGNPNPLPRIAGTPLVIQARDYTSLRSARTGREIGRLDFRIGGFAMNADHSRMVAGVVRKTGETGPQIAMIHLRSGTQLWTAQVSETEEGGIKEMGFSKDGRRLFVLLRGSKSSSVFLKVFDTADGHVVATLSSESRVIKFEQLADPDLIVTLDYAHSARVWRLSTGEEVRRVAHGFSTDGASVATKAPRAVTWKQGSLRMWNLRDGSEIAHRIATGDVEEAALDPAGRRVAYRVARAQRGDSGAPFQAILLWEVDKKGDNGTMRRIPIGGNPQGLVFDRSGKRLAARVGDHEIRIWDVATLRQVATLRSTQGAKFFDDHRFSKHGDYYFAWEGDTKAGGYTSHFRAWRLSGRGQPVEIARLDGPRHVAEGADGTLLTAGKQGGRLWDLGAGSQEKLAFPGARYCCAGVASSERRVINKDYDAIRALDTASGNIIEMTCDPASDSLSAASFSQDFSSVFMAERDRRDDQLVPGTVRLRSVPDGREIAQIRPEATIARILPVGGDEAALLLGSPGGWIIGGKYELALLWRPADGRLLHLNGDNPVGAAEVSPDGQLIVLGEGVEEEDHERWVVRGKPRVTIWNARNGKLLRTLAFQKPPTDIAFSADGRVMVVRDSFTFVAFEVGSWQKLHRTKAEFGDGSGRTAILDGEWIVVPDRKSVRLVSIRSGDEINLRHATDHPAFVLSGDDRVFATVDRGSLRVWQLPSKPTQTLWNSATDSAVLLAKFENPPSGSNRPVFAGAGNRLFVTGENSLNRLLYRPDELETDVCQRMGRGLNKEEVAAFFPNELPLNPCQNPD